ncbi:unnamed protein product [Pieris brassicae]|uniref:Uncharacterized protein n=1 Tax=Pieris brassicae TaxID=7116 RepID=A0A9P0X4Z6_PIEBR|nr:unnamed protein product [Pieris brassicae]
MAKIDERRCKTRTTVCTDAHRATEPVEIRYLLIRHHAFGIDRAYDSHKDCPEEDVILSMDGIEYNVYYIYSLLFLLLRSIMISMMAVHVNTEALKPLTVLRNIQTQDYTLDVRTF